MSNIRFEFSGQNVIVTGGTRGIGRAISKALLETDATVIATYRKDDEAARAFKDSRGAKGEKLVLRKFDVADYAQVEAFFRQYENEHKALHVLINNSGIRRDAIVGAMSPEDWNDVIATNLGGTFNMSKFAARMMMTQRYGRIVNVTSPSGKHGFAGQGNYAASKAGQVGFTKSLARELASRGITVNCVSPGFIDTELIANLSDDLKATYRGQIPMKRFGTPAEVVQAVLFLASREAGYITGATLDVTGGF